MKEDVGTWVEVLHLENYTQAGKSTGTR
jgi:hypothetical protein